MQRIVVSGKTYDLPVSQNLVTLARDIEEATLEGRALTIEALSDDGEQLILVLNPRRLGSTLFRTGNFDRSEISPAPPEEDPPSPPSADGGKGPSEISPRA